MPEFREGQTATGPGGAKIVYRGGKWQPASEGAGSPGINPDWVGRRTRGEPVLHPADDPFRHLADPKRRDITRGSMLASGGKFLEKQQPNINTARDTLSSLDEFDAINERLRPSGGIVNRAGNWVQEKLGSNDHERMTQIGNNFARNMRQAGEGAVSDYEGRLFQQMVGGYDKTYATNRQFSVATRNLAKRRIEMHQFQEAYLRSNGTLVGWDSMWSAYRDRNPIVDKKGRALNPPSWQQFFANEARNIAAGRDGMGRPKAPPSAARNQGWSTTRIK
jgi:hypothetical protein